MARRVIVCGSRGFGHETLVEAWLGTECDARTTVVHGACLNSPDETAAHWCARNDRTDEPHPAEWSKHPGKSAAFVRNAEMAKLGASLMLAFWDGLSPGTLHMIQCAVQRGIPVRIIPKGAPL